MTRSLLETVPARLASAHTALVVIDMQNDFCAEGGYVETVVGRSAAACRAVVDPIVALIGAAHRFGVPVILVRAIYDHARLPESMLVKQRQKGDAECCATESWGSAFFGIRPREGDVVVDKHSYSAFVGTGLEALLRGRGVRTVVFAGVQTNVCVETSLRDAFCIGFHTVIASDCVASHAGALHEATLKNVEFLFGDVLSASRITEIWSGAGEDEGTPP